MLEVSTSAGAQGGMCMSGHFSSAEYMRRHRCRMLPEWRCGLLSPQAATIGACRGWSDALRGSCRMWPCKHPFEISTRSPGVAEEATRHSWHFLLTEGSWGIAPYALHFHLCHLQSAPLQVTWRLQRLGAA